MLKATRPTPGPITRTAHALQPACGSVRTCVPYAGELARHRLISADGCDYVVATAFEAGRHRAPRYITGAYPVTRGYLVMLRQPLCEIESEHADQARREHEALVRVLVEAGVRLVRARRILAARQRAERAERAEALRASSRTANISVLTPTPTRASGKDAEAPSALAGLSELTALPAVGRVMNAASDLSAAIS